MKQINTKFRSIISKAKTFKKPSKRSISLPNRLVKFVTTAVFLGNTKIWLSQKKLEARSTAVIFLAKPNAWLIVISHGSQAKDVLQRERVITLGWCSEE